MMLVDGITRSLISRLVVHKVKLRTVRFGPDFGPNRKNRKNRKNRTETEPNRSVRPETYLVIVERRILAH